MVVLVSKYRFINSRINTKTFFLYYAHSLVYTGALVDNSVRSLVYIFIGSFDSILYMYHVV